MCLHVGRLPLIPLTFIREVHIPNTGLRLAFNGLVLVIIVFHGFLVYSYLFSWNAGMVVTLPEIELIQPSILEGVGPPTDPFCFNTGRPPHNFLGVNWLVADQCVEVCDTSMTKPQKDSCANPFDLIQPQGSHAWLLGTTLMEYSVNVAANGSLVRRVRRRFAPGAFHWKVTVAFSYRTLSDLHIFPGSPSYIAGTHRDCTLVVVGPTKRVARITDHPTQIVFTLKELIGIADWTTERVLVYGMELYLELRCFNSLTGMRNYVNDKDLAAQAGIAPSSHNIVCVISVRSKAGKAYQSSFPHAQAEDGHVEFARLAQGVVVRMPEVISAMYFPSFIGVLLLIVSFAVFVKAAKYAVRLFANHCLGRLSSVYSRLFFHEQPFGRMCASWMLQLVMFAAVHHGIAREVQGDDEEEIGEPKLVITKAAFEDTLLSCLRGHKKMSDREILNIADFALEEMKPEVTGSDFEGNYTLDCHQFVELSMALQGIPCDTFLDMMCLYKSKSRLEWMFTPPRMKVLLGKQGSTGPAKSTGVSRAKALKEASVQRSPPSDQKDDDSFYQDGSFSRSRDGSLSQATASPKKASPKNRDPTSNRTSEPTVDADQLNKHWQDTKTQIDKMVSMLEVLDHRMTTMHHDQKHLELQIGDAKTELREARDRLKQGTDEHRSKVEEAMNTLKSEIWVSMSSLVKDIEKEKEYGYNHIQAEIKMLKRNTDKLTKKFDLNTTRTDANLNELRELANNYKEAVEDVGREVRDVQNLQAPLNRKLENEDAKKIESHESVLLESSQGRMSVSSFPKQQDEVYSSSRRSCDVVGGLFTNSNR